MKALQIVRVAVRALMRNKMRSLLTSLGIIIGVSAVIAMVAIGQGAKARVEEQFASMGSNLLIVMSGSATTGGSRGGYGSLPTLTLGDLQAMRTELSAVTYAAPVYSTRASIVSDEQNWSTSVSGTTEEYFLIRNWRPELGRVFTDTESETATKVAVLGRTVSDNLFGANADPLGQIVRIKNIPFEVIGVLARKGQSPMGQNYDDTVLIPANTFRTKIQGSLNQFISGVIFVGSSSPAGIARAQTQIAGLLRDRHRLSKEAPDDFSIINLTEIANAQEEGTRTLTLLLSSIAAVSLLVGGIGIMNIMLVSVTERTREIGLRMAVGAQPAHILIQFLIEALALSLAGGLIGVIVGLVMARVLSGYFGWPLLIQPGIIILAVCFSGAIGVIFGLYPARKAARLDPIEALRFE